MVYIVRVNMTIEDFTYTHVCDSLEDSKRIVKKCKKNLRLSKKNLKTQGLNIRARLVAVLCMKILKYAR